MKTTRTSGAFLDRRHKIENSELHGAHSGLENTRRYGEPDNCTESKTPEFKLWSRKGGTADPGDRPARPIRLSFSERISTCKLRFAFAFAERFCGLGS